MKKTFESMAELKALGDAVMELLRKRDVSPG